MNLFPNTHLKSNTYEPYNRKLHKWLSLFPESQSSLHFLYTHPNFSIVTLRKYLVTQQVDTATTLNSYIKAALAAAEHNSSLFTNEDPALLLKCHTRWKEMRNHTYQDSMSYRMDATPAPSQVSKAGSQLTFSELCTIRDELPQDSIAKLLLAFYTFIPPVRADYFATEILPFGKSPSYPNYIHVNSERSSMTLTDFKTSAVYKSIHQDLPPALHSLLAHSLSIHPRTFLFINRFGKPFERNNFSIWAADLLEKTLQRPFTLTLFRHIYISHLDPSMTPRELQTISLKMGHSLTQQLLYRWKSDPKMDDD